MVIVEIESTDRLVGHRELNTTVSSGGHHVTADVQGKRIERRIRRSVGERERNTLPAIWCRATVDGISSDICQEARIGLSRDNDSLSVVIDERVIGETVDVIGGAITIEIQQQRSIEVSGHERGCRRGDDRNRGGASGITRQSLDCVVGNRGTSVGGRITSPVAVHQLQHDAIHRCGIRKVFGNRVALDPKVGDIGALRSGGVGRRRIDTDCISIGVCRSETTDIKVCVV